MSEQIYLHLQNGPAHTLSPNVNLPVKTVCVKGGTVDCTEVTDYKHLSNHPFSEPHILCKVVGMLETIPAFWATDREHPRHPGQSISGLTHTHTYTHLPTGKLFHPMYVFGLWGKKACRRNHNINREYANSTQLGIFLLRKQS